MQPVTFVVIGAGSRGRTYSQFALEQPEKAKVVGVAEPRKPWHDSFVEQHAIKSEYAVETWKEIAEMPKFADAAIISTQDAMHVEPAIAMAKKGYHILLEKPMATTADGCNQIVNAVLEAGVMLGVCHIFRYTTYTKKIKVIIDSGAIGEVVSVEHLEPIGYWHFAHSYVRGNWGNESASAPMLLAKSCHDLDWLRYIIGARCKKVSSFGGLFYFQPDRKPIGAGQRCLDCSIEGSCLFSAKSFYLNLVRKGNLGWPVDVITADLTEDGVTEALRMGPYGRCVWACDNDVTDHQVVSLEFDGGQTASFTVTAFTEGRARQTRIYGTSGELRGDGKNIEVFDFQTEQTKHTEANMVSDGSILSGHDGGDYEIIKAFTEAVAKKDPGLILSGPEESLETHLMVFAAEKARHENSVIELSEMGI